MNAILPSGRVGGAGTHNRYEGRWRYWYDAIADAIIRHPGIQVQTIAEALGKHPNTISAIMQTDLFRTYLSKRKAEWRASHDDKILSLTTDIAELGLELIRDRMQEKRTAIPMNLLASTTGDALDRLGFGSKNAPAVLVNNNFGDQSQKTFVAVTANELEEAREALRRAERARLVEPTTTQLIEHHKEASSEPLSAD